MTRLWMLAVLLVAACAARQSEVQDDSPQGRCARQVANAPAIRDIRMKQVSEPDLQIRLQPDLKETTAALMQQCLLMYGIGVPGGVQPPAPYKGQSGPIGH